MDCDLLSGVNNKVFGLLRCQRKTEIMPVCQRFFHSNQWSDSAKLCADLHIVGGSWHKLENLCGLSRGYGFQDKRVADINLIRINRFIAVCVCDVMH